MWPLALARMVAGGRHLAPRLTLIMGACQGITRCLGFQFSQVNTAFCAYSRVVVVGIRMVDMTGPTKTVPAEM